LRSALARIFEQPVSSISTVLAIAIIAWFLGIVAMSITI